MTDKREPSFPGHILNRDRWSVRGPWQDELVDAYEWTDAATNLECWLWRDDPGGFWRGAVRLPDSHPASHMNAYDIGMTFDAHGGVERTDDGVTRRLAFHCGHRATDVLPGETLQHKKDRDVYPWSSARYWTVEQAKRECERLASQVSRP